MTNNTNTGDASFIPMPSRKELEAEVRRDADMLNWGMGGKPVDPAQLTDGQYRAMMEAKLNIGPRNGDAFAVEAWQQAKRVDELERERAALVEKITAVRFEHSLGTTVPVFSDAERRAFKEQIEAGEAEATSLKGVYGRERLERAMSEAVEQRKARHREAYIAGEAEKRVAAAELEQAIAARMKVLAVRKTGGRTAGESQ